MKKKFRINNLIGKKSVILAAVSLILVLVLAVGVTTSWIEEVSQVEFNSTDDSQKTPLHVGDKSLLADAEMKKDANYADDNNTINLNDYFYESGDMHLSPCYSNGEDFYFPVQEKTAGETKFRVGTKDDANVNYMSATFRINSIGANTAYWFEKSGSNYNLPYITFKKGNTSANNPNPNPYDKLRCSVSIDGVTTVYALNSTGEFKSLSSSTASSASTYNGKRIDQYTYYKEDYNDNSPEGYYKNESANITNKPNQGAGAGENLNGNTLFSVSTYDSTNKTTQKTVTVKIWLEYDSDAEVNSSVDVASVNMNFISSWAKTRRIYVKDATVYQEGYDSAKWLNTYSNGNLYFGIKNNLSDAHWKLNRIGTSDYYFIDIPAVYNNTEAVFFRCSNNGWNNGNKTYDKGNVSIACWNYWETTFPDTFHSEVYTVYSTDFATWESADNVHSVYIVNSTDFNDVYDYMWDSNSVISGQTEIGGVEAKVVKNAEWPGLKMTTLMKARTSSQSLKTYAFFYNADYDRVIFDDGDYHEGVNQEYQTQDLWLTKNEINKTFDMATLTWFNTNPTNTSVWNDSNHSVMPYYSSDKTYLFSNLSTNNQWKKTRFAYGGTLSGTSSSKMICKLYNKVSAPKNRIYFKKPNDWSTVKAYFWGGTGNYTSWPGSAMTLQAADVYYIDIPDGAPTNVQFNNGTDEHKYDGLSIQGGKMFDDGSWQTHVSDFEMKLVNNGTFYGAYSEGDKRIFPGNSYTLGTGNNYNENLIIKELKDQTVYRFYFDWDNGNPRISLEEGE